MSRLAPRRTRTHHEGVVCDKPSQFIDGVNIPLGRFTAHVRAAAEPWAERPVRHGLVTLASHEQSSSLQPATDGLAAEHRQSTAS